MQSNSGYFKAIHGVKLLFLHCVLLYRVSTWWGCQQINFLGKDFQCNFVNKLKVAGELPPKISDGIFHIFLSPYATLFL